MAGGKKVNVTQISAAVEQAKAPAVDKTVDPGDETRFAPDLKKMTPEERAKHMAMKARAWAFTVMNYTALDIELVIEMIRGSRYGICGYEVCPTTGTPHLQGFVYWPNAKERQIVHKFVPRGIFNIKYPRANANQNDTYCAKEGCLLIRVGEPPKQGERTDLEETYRILRSGGGVREVSGAMLGTQCLRVAETWLKYHEPKRCKAPEIIWIHGPKGAGKTWAAYEMFGVDADDVYSAPRTTSKFWDGYDGHKCVLIDDIRRDWCKFVELLGITDRYAYQVEVKGASRQLLAEKIIITCPYTPEELFSDVGEDVGQLTGRITAILSMEGKASRRREPHRGTVDDFLSRTRDNEGSTAWLEERALQEETPADDAYSFKNFKPGNNLGVPVTPDNGTRKVSRRENHSQEDQEGSQDLRARLAYWRGIPQEGDSEAIGFPQTPSLCSSQSDHADGVYQQEYDATPDDPGGEDSDADQGEP